MLLLLQEALEYIEEQYKFLCELNVVTIASERHYKQIHCKLSIEISNLLDVTHSEMQVKADKNNDDYMYYQASVFHQEEEVEDKDQNFQQKNITVSKTNRPEDHLMQHNVQGKSSEAQHFSDRVYESGINYSNEENMYTHEKSSTADEEDSIQEPEMDNDFTKESDSDNAEQISPKHSSLRDDLNIDFISHAIGAQRKSCKNVFFRKNSLVYNRKKNFKCDICNDEFPTNRNLRIHVAAIHTVEKTFKCDICDKIFSRNDNLYNHRRIHTGDKTFHCDICDKSFVKNGNLKRHMLVHTGEKPFKCSICNKGFNAKHTLQRHSTIHTGEKPFKCCLCHKAFNQKGYLRSHMLIHTDE